MFVINYRKYHGDGYDFDGPGQVLGKSTVQRKSE